MRCRSGDPLTTSQNADERTRTSTDLHPHGPEPCASTNSATSASGSGPNISHAAPRSGRLCSPPRARRLARARFVRRRRESPSSRFASLVRAIRAAIVQGTRTPPSHGGNPGSNPGSGTSPTPYLRGRYRVELRLRVKPHGIEGFASRPVELDPRDLSVAQSHDGDAVRLNVDSTRSTLPAHAPEGNDRVRRSVD